MGGGVSTNHKSSNNWIILIQSTFFKFLVFWPDPTQPPTHQTIHPLIGGEFFTDFKSSNRIEISWLVQALSNFYWFWGCTPMGDHRWVDGGGGGYGCVGGCPMHTHMYTHAHAHTHMHVKHANHAKHGCLHVSGHLQFLYMYTCVYVRLRACACMCMCGGTPPMPPDAPDNPPPPAPSPEPQGAQNTKIQ